jgi:hypothetical protein
MKKEFLSEQLKRMRQLAGLISESDDALVGDNEDYNNRSHTLFTLEVLPKFWEDMNIKRPAYSGGDEAGMSLLSRDNTIQLTVGDEPIPIYRRDTRIYDDKGQKAGRGDDSEFYMMKLYKSNYQKSDENILKYSLDFQNDKDAKLGGNMNLKPIGNGNFTSQEVGSMDTTKRFKIVAVK